MRVRVFTVIAFTAAALSMAPSGAQVLAAQVRSADDIAKDLTPSASMLSGPTRGIRPAAPGTGGTGSNSYVPAATGNPAGGKGSHAGVSGPHSAAPASNLTVQFKNGSAELTPQAVQQLTELGKALSSNAMSGFKFRVEGHTDTVGTKEGNMTLSEQRANAVAEFLEKKFNISRARVEAVGMGSEHALVPTPDQTPEPRNRRVQVINLGGV